jgi:hypothetical protein
LMVNDAAFAAVGAIRATAEIARPIATKTLMWLSPFRQKRNSFRSPPRRSVEAD